MLNQRQLEILLELCENAGEYMSASYFASKQECSLRTVQNDMKLIKDTFKGTACARLESIVPKGTRVVVTDSEAFWDLRTELYQQFSNTSMSSQEERVNQLLLLLLQQKRSLSMYDLESKIFISRSTLFSDLKAAEQILDKYGLELMRSSSKVFIDGTEIDKRRCLYEENLMMGRAADLIRELAPSSAQNDDDEVMGKLKDILVKTFVHYKHTMSEVALNNTIVHLFVSVRRLENYFLIDESELEIQGDLAPFSQMSEAIFEDIGRSFLLRVPQTEIDYFALYLKGTGNATSESVISDETNALLLDGLRAIRKNCGIDLTDDVNLRISLGLHLTSLLIRVKYNMQLDNHLVSYIRQTFPQGYDIATYFAEFLKSKCKKPIREEEIAFLAIHLYTALSQLQSRTGTRRVLVISSLRRSENILLRQTLYNWFKDQIAELFMVMPQDMNDSYLDRYDTFVTTEKGRFYEAGLALYINPFPNRQDYLNLKLAMDGFKSAQDIVDIFAQDLFFVLGKEDHDSALELLCHACEDTFAMNDLLDNVKLREEMGSTFFGNRLAAAHPHSPISPDTFIAVGIARDPIVWDEEGNKVNILLLVHIGKNNPKAFQLWNYLSKIINDEKFADHLLANPTYDNFLYLVKEAIAKEMESDTTRKI